MRIAARIREPAAWFPRQRLSDCRPEIQPPRVDATAEPKGPPGGAGGVLLATLVVCGGLAMGVVAIVASFVYSRFEGSRASVFAFAIGGVALAVGIVVALAMGQPS